MSLSNVTITLQNSTRVTIATTSVKDKLSNQLTTTFVTPTTATTNTASTKVGNLLKIVEKITVTGHITTGLNPNASNPTELTNAKDLKNALKTIFKNRNTATLAYDGDSYSITIDDLDITESARNGEEAVEGETRYDVTISCIVGTNLIPIKT